MDALHNKRRSVLLVVGVTLILSLLTLVFYRKIYSMLATDREAALLTLTEQYALSYEKSLENALEYLSGVAGLAGSEHDTVRWEAVSAALMKSPFIFDDVGVVDLQGNGIVGKGLAVGGHTGIRQAFRGYRTVTAMPGDPAGGRARFLFSVPVKAGKNIRYALYGIMSERTLAGMLDQIPMGLESWPYITDGEYNLVLPIGDAEMHSRVSGWMTQPERYGVEKNVERLRNMVKRYKRGVEVFSVAGENYYVDVVPMQMNGWLFTSVVSGQALRRQINAVVTLFLLVFGALLLLFVVVLAYMQVADANHRAHIHNLAYVDRLTGLPNWEKAKLDLRRLIASEKGVEEWTLVTFDVKNFKMFNELFGYRRGNETLISIAESLRTAGDGVRLACRVENDCFAFVTPGGNSDDTTARIKAHLDRIADLDRTGNPVPAFSCGACVFHASGPRDWDSHMNSAKMSRQTVKWSRETEIAFYDNQVKERLVLAQRLRNDMDRAIHNDEFVMFLQPKFSIALRGQARLVGAEALVRWEHRDLGMLQPGRFIPVFEEDGSVEKVDRFIFMKGVNALDAGEGSGVRCSPYRSTCRGCSSTLTVFPTSCTPSPNSGARRAGSSTSS